MVGDLAVSRAGTRVSGPDLGSRKARVLLGLLAAARPVQVPADRLVEGLWGDDPPLHPAENIASLVSRLRREFGAGFIEGGRDGYRLGDTESVVVDLDEANGWLAEAEVRLAGDEPGLAVAAAERAHDLLRAGPLLGGEAAEWADPLHREHDDLSNRLRHVLADACLQVGDYNRALSEAAAAEVADPYDEQAVRTGMLAHVCAGEPAKALASYARLRDRLAEDLGADPAAETEALHLTVLQAKVPPQLHPRQRTRQPERRPLAGRDEELGQLARAWGGSATGRAHLLLVIGEGGIGKTKLCEEFEAEATRTGAQLLHARCYETERSLFLQPILEAIGGLMRSSSPATFRQLAGEHGEVLAGLIPEAAAVLGPPAVRQRGSADLEKRRAFDAVRHFFRTLSARNPVLLILDDLHNAGHSTTELLHYLTRRLPQSRLLIVGTVRTEESVDIIRALGDIAERLELGPLSLPAVTELAAKSHQADRAEQILARTGGHALYVVETIRALAGGSEGIPPSLEEAVTGRVRKTGKAVEETLRAAAILGSSFEPQTLAGLMSVPVHTVAGRCADALSARLLTVSDRYEFAHDLVREVLYATTPDPVRRAYHLRAADLFTEHPEALAAHAAAAGDWARAARGWLLAGEEALARAAAEDAVELFTSALGASETAAGLEDVRARALLGRGRARASGAGYPAAMADVEAAALSAGRSGDARLQMLALRELGGEIALAVGLPAAGCMMHLEKGLELARASANSTMKIEFESWLAIIAVHDLRFAESFEHGQQAVAVARAIGDEEALAAALDARKTSLAYIGRVQELKPVILELEPILRRRGDTFRLHWTIFESSFERLAAGDWSGATERIQTAIDVQRRGGLIAYTGWHVAHLGWVAQLKGDYEAAARFGREALEIYREAPHVPATAVATAQLGVTLLEAGEHAAAVKLLEEATDLARHQGLSSTLLRCLAPLAQASGSLAVLEEADALIRGITAPPGSAFLLGYWCHLAVARAWLDRGEPDRAEPVVAPLLAAADRFQWPAVLAEASLVAARAASLAGRPEQARRAWQRAVALARAHPVPAAVRAEINSRPA